MDSEPHIHPTVHESSPTYNGFWPVLLIGASLIVILSWEIWVGVSTRKSAQQAKQVQAGLEKLVRGLVDLAKTDENAQKLVTKFGIKVNEPTVPTSTLTP